MKISNEAKVGTLAIVSIALLIFGYNFLRGRSVMKTGNFLYTKYSDAKSLMVSNPVYIIWFQVGKVGCTDVVGALILTNLFRVSLYHMRDYPGFSKC